MNAKSLKEVKLLRCNRDGDKIEDILIESDHVMYDINENRRRLFGISNNNTHINDKITNINDNNNNDNDMNVNNKNCNNDNINNNIDDIINKENENDMKLIPFTFSIQYTNIKNMENVIWSTANTLLKKNKIIDDNNNDTNNNNNDILTELPDFSNDVELYQINKIKELISWRQELMKNCVNNN